MVYKMDWPKLAEIVAKEVNKSFMTPPAVILSNICEHDHEMYVELLEQSQKGHSRNLYFFLSEIRDRYRAYITEIAQKTNNCALSIGDDKTAEEYSTFF